MFVIGCQTDEVVETLAQGVEVRSSNPKVGNCVVRLDLISPVFGLIILFVSVAVEVMAPLLEVLGEAVPLAHNEQYIFLR